MAAFSTMARVSAQRLEKGGEAQDEEMPQGSEQEDQGGEVSVKGPWESLRHTASLCMGENRPGRVRNLPQIIKMPVLQAQHLHSPGCPTDERVEILNPLLLPGNP